MITNQWTPKKIAIVALVISGMIATGLYFIYFARQGDPVIVSPETEQIKKEMLDSEKDKD